MPYYWPERSYPVLNSVSYPDHSRELPGMNGVIRAFRLHGEQMYDEDLNNATEWIGRWWANTNVMNRWFSPQYPWYSPHLRTYLTADDHNQPGLPDAPHAVVFNYSDPSPDYYLKPWPGVTVTVLADRQWVGFNSNDTSDPEVGEWRGLAQFQEYPDEIEIAVFMSETRADRIVAAMTVKEPFRLHADCYSGRVRGWTMFGNLSILKNGDVVGKAYQAEFTSGVVALSGEPVEFLEGDVLAIKAPSVSPLVGKIYKAVCVSIVGELL